MTYAGFWKRFVAMAADCLILVIPMIALNFAIPYVGTTILAVLYYPVFESSSIQATPGKYWMGLKVLSENGQTLSFPKALARYFLKIVSSIILGIGYLMQLFTAKRQTLHDLITNAVVVEHTYLENPDWIQTWIKQMRFVLRLDEKGTEAVQTTFFDPPSASSNTSAEAVQSIEKLYELFKSGVLTEEEFQTKKAELLKQV